MNDGSRRTFLEQLAGAAGGFALARLASGCGTPVDGSVTPVGGVATLSFTQFPQLQTVGDSVIVDAGSTRLLVVRISSTAATALSATCTHQSCTVSYQGGNVPIECGCHGSQFQLDGSVLRGPARRALALYPAALDASGVAVTLG
jgi:cytochrome b6-f complex iron-sulfur subunit